MNRMTIYALGLIIGLAYTQCDKEQAPGHLEISVTYPEAVVENGSISWIDVPGIGAEVRLYDGDAQCLGYRDAKIDVAWVGDEPVASKFVRVVNGSGEVLFKDIPAGGYYLVICAAQLYKYTEKYIDVIGGETLELSKNFTPEGSIFRDLEPWDYVMPTK